MSYGFSKPSHNFRALSDMSLEPSGIDVFGYGMCEARLIIYRQDQRRHDDSRSRGV